MGKGEEGEKGEQAANFLNCACRSPPNFFSFAWNTPLSLAAKCPTKKKSSTPPLDPAHFGLSHFIRRARLSHKRELLKAVKAERPASDAAAGFMRPSPLSPTGLDNPGAACVGPSLRE